MVVNLQDVVMIGAPIVTFFVTYGVVQYKVSSLMKRQTTLERRTNAVLNFARWYLSDKEHMPLDKINEILGVKEEDE